jgi:hypothetical protein
MIEAVVVLPVLITCWGVMMFAGGARYHKQLTQQKARSAIFTYATSGCDGNLVDANGTNGPTLPSITSQAGKPGDNAGAASGAANDTTQGHDAFFTISGDTSSSWTWDSGYVHAAAPISGHSFYFCNEKPVSGLLGFFEYALNVIKQVVPSNVPGAQ